MPDRCLLVIDLQNDFVGRNPARRCEGGREIIPAVAAGDAFRTGDGR
ncbi:MAG: hypothetical protein ACYC6I_11975 [Bacillota bacterium]